VTVWAHCFPNPDVEIGLIEESVDLFRELCAVIRHQKKDFFVHVRHVVLTSLCCQTGRFHHSLSRRTSGLAATYSQTMAYRT
jgi:hypothetical protein